MPGYGDSDIIQDLEREAKDLRFQIEVLHHEVAAGIAQRAAADSWAERTAALLREILQRWAAVDRPALFENMVTANALLAEYKTGREGNGG